MSIGDVSVWTFSFENKTFNLFSFWVVQPKGFAVLPKRVQSKKTAKIFEREKENISLGESLKKSSASKNVKDEL